MVLVKMVFLRYMGKRQVSENIAYSALELALSLHLQGFFLNNNI
jgi:hypothetical protein